MNRNPIQNLTLKNKMKTLCTIMALGILAGTLQAAPKKILVVETTSGFRHSSIPTGEKVLSELAQKSGAFTLDFVKQPPGHAAVGFPVKLKPGATEDEKKAFDAAEAKWTEALKAELQKLSPESLKLLQ